MTGATAYDDPTTGETFILVCPQSLWLGSDHKESLICPNQIRRFGLEIDDIPHQFSRGKSIHGICVDDLVLPFTLEGCISYLPTREPTDVELDKCPRFTLTSELQWDPNSNDLSKGEDLYNAGTATISATNTHLRRVQIDVKTLQRRLGGVSEQTALATIEGTTQLGTRDGLMPLHKRYRTRQQHLKYRRLNATFYSDTMLSSIKSLSGNMYSQIFVNDTNFVYHYPMKLKSQAYEGLQQLIFDVGIPGHLHTDNANEETKGNWERECRRYCIKQTATEPYTPWQNKAEREIQESKKTHRRLMNSYQVPQQLWDYCVKFAAELRSKTVHPHLNGRSPYEILTGDTPDISHLMHFDFYQAVTYLEQAVSFPEVKEKLGKWLGPAHNIGQAMCYYVLKPNGQVISRSTVSAVDMTDEDNRTKVKELTKDINISVGEHVPVVVKNDDEQGENQYFDWEENDMLSDGLLGAEVVMPHGETNEVARVVGRKRDSDGNT
ncbi:MAG: hypothetical protein ACREBR_01060, partial [bacterium]